MVCNRKSEFSAQCEHLFVLAEDEPFHLFHPVRSGKIDQLTEQFPTKALPLQVRSDKHCVFREAPESIDFASRR